MFHYLLRYLVLPAARSKIKSTNRRQRSEPRSEETLFHVLKSVLSAASADEFHLGMRAYGVVWAELPHAKSARSAKEELMFQPCLRQSYVFRTSSQS